MVYQLCTTLFQCYFNIDMTLSQRCFKVTSTLVKAILKPIGIVIVWFCLYRLISFILLSENCFNILIIQLLTKYLKNFPTLEHIVTHNSKNVDIHRSLKYCNTQILKTPRKIYVKMYVNYCIIHICIYIYIYIYIYSLFIQNI